jgi:hypothetical protein
LRAESGKTDSEFLDVVWNRREAWRQGDVGISRAVLRVVHALEPNYTVKY